MADVSDADRQGIQPTSPDILSASDLNGRIASLIEQSSEIQNVRCIGEVTDLHHNSTALYFTLTDGNAELPCMIWANRYRKMDAELEDGTDVILEGDIDYCTEGRKIDLKPWDVIVVGDGDQAAAVERLRSELDERGWFDDEQKQRPPAFPERVGVVTSLRGPVAPPEIMEALDLSNPTTYEYVDRLVDIGLVDRDDSTRPQQLTVDPIIIVEQYVPIIIMSTVLHALGLQEVDEDIEYFVDRYGLGKLIAALRGAGLYVAGTTTQRMIAGDIDVRETEAMMIIYALKPALTVGREHDPFFEYLFPDEHDEMDLPDLDTVENAPTRPSDTDR